MNLGWRQLALWLLIFGEAGVLLELVFLEHFEDIWQGVPIILLAGGLVTGLWAARTPGPKVFKALLWIMVLQLGAGAVGLFLHLKANIEFELELHPDSGGWQLIYNTLSGAIPALAPGAMFQLGLLGILVCWRHPDRLPASDEPAGHGG